jgi:hypothetical protein
MSEQGATTVERTMSQALLAALSKVGAGLLP